MVDRLFIAWQDTVTRAWHTIARVTRDERGYEFVFTEGAERLHSIPEELFRMSTQFRYRFDKLIPFLTNRIPSRNRDDYLQMAGWLNLSGRESDFDLLSKFGLIPGGDSFLIYPEPTLEAGMYSLEFFVHGIRHMHEDAAEWCQTCNAGDQLFPLLDVKNRFDENAVALRSESGTLLLGYVPAFYASDFRKLLESADIARLASVTVVKHNADAPIQLRLLCKFFAYVPPDFTSLDTDAHKPLVGEMVD